MTKKHNIEKGLDEKLDDLSQDEVEAILENLIKEFYKAYSDYNLPMMKHFIDELERTKKAFKGKYNNIEHYCTFIKLSYASNLSVLKDRKNIKANTLCQLMTFSLLSYQLGKNYEFMLSVLNTYFFNHGDDEVLMDQLDKLIRMLRDNMLQLMNLIEEYHHHYTKKEIENIILSIREHIHDIIEKEEFGFVKEMDGVDIEMTLIELYNFSFTVEQAYETIKKEVDDLFKENNGFKQIIREIECRMNGIPEDKLDELLLEYPQYNIMETKYIPKRY